MAIKAVLWDMDGTLVKTEHIKTQAHQAAVAYFGGTLTQDIHAQTMGTSAETTHRLYMEYSGLDVPFDEYRAYYLAMCRDMRRTRVEVVAGAEKTLETLKMRGVNQAIVTSSGAESMREVMEKTGLKRYFSAFVCADDVRIPKPDPEPYHLGLSRVHARPIDAIVIEDTDAGVLSGKRAGIRVLGIRHEYNASQSLSDALTILPGLEDTARATTLICDMLQL